MVDDDGGSFSVAVYYVLVDAGVHCLGMADDRLQEGFGDIGFDHGDHGVV